MPASKVQTKSSQNIINHIGLVLDASSSMMRHTTNVVKVADNLIRQLAEQSKILDQETRVSVYTFSYSYNILCLIYDKDVLRMPSIAGLYHAEGMTALCSATTLVIRDLQLTPEKYGEHSFLLYVVTDGQENNSIIEDRQNLPVLIKGLPEHWTLAAFVPNANGVYYAKQHGFPAGNIAVWDTADSFLEVGQKIETSIQNFMQARTTGVRGSKSLFTMNKVSVSDIKAQLTPMTPGSYWFEHITDADTNDQGKVCVGEFCSRRLGDMPDTRLYEMTKREPIQDYKKVAIWIPEEQHLYVGKDARGMLGLPDVGTVRISPGDHPDYKIYVQSTAMNRNLFTGTDLLLFR